MGLDFALQGREFGVDVVYGCWVLSLPQGGGVDFFHVVGVAWPVKWSRTSRYRCSRPIVFVIRLPVLLYVYAFPIRS